jgi:hypothetical protein
VRRLVQASTGDSTGIMGKDGSCALYPWYLCSELQRLSDQRCAEKSQQVLLKYLGTAGWEIADGTCTTGRRVGPLPSWRHSSGVWLG